MASRGLSDEGCSGTDAWPDSGAWPVIKDGRAVAYTVSGTYPGPEIMVDWLINFGWSDWRLICKKTCRFPRDWNKFLRDSRFIKTVGREFSNAVFEILTHHLGMSGFNKTGSHCLNPSQLLCSTERIDFSWSAYWNTWMTTSLIIAPRVPAIVGLLFVCMNLVPDNAASSSVLEFEC